MRTAVGGTFNILHDGHKALLDTAFEDADEVFIGITTDEMSASSRNTTIPFYLRKKAVIEYLREKDTPYEIFEISDMYGPAVEIDDIDVLVTSKETENNGILVNDERIRRGMRPLTIKTIEMRQGPEGDVIRAREVLSGEYSRSGDRRAMSIAVGSLNPVKTEAVRAVMEKIYGNVRIIPKDVGSGVPEQPWGTDTYKGAVNRAKAAMDGNDLAVGIEAGVFDIYDGIYDVQHCAILDTEGNMTVGMGSGFRYPDDVAELVRNGSSVGDAMRKLHNEDRGSREGAIGFLTNGLLDRRSLTEQSVMAAMVPRIRK